MFFVLLSGPNEIKNFGIFQDRISLKFLSRILSKSPGSLRITFSAYKFGRFHTSLMTCLLVEDPRRIFTSSCFLWSGSSSLSFGKQQERAGVQCCWQRGDPKKSLPRTRESLRYCQIQPWSVKRHGLLK